MPLPRFGHGRYDRRRTARRARLLERRLEANRSWRIVFLSLYSPCKRVKQITSQRGRQVKPAVACCHMRPLASSGL